MIIQCCIGFHQLYRQLYIHLYVHLCGNIHYAITFTVFMHGCMQRLITIRSVMFGFIKHRIIIAIEWYVLVVPYGTVSH